MTLNATWFNYTDRERNCGNYETHERRERVQNHLIIGGRESDRPLEPLEGDGPPEPLLYLFSTCLYNVKSGGLHHE